jgi:S-adenosylmethionine:tRNA ribosyltransferase-isomerase
VTDLSSTSAYHYELPDELIASQPADRRANANMLVVDGRDGSLTDRNVRDFPDYLAEGDLLVFNNARVVPARLRARRKTGGKVEVFVVGTSAEGSWEENASECRALLRANKRLGEGEELLVEGSEAQVVIRQRLDGGVVVLDLENTSMSIIELLEMTGETPLPPYIVKARERRGEPTLNESDPQRYQTVFAKQPGAVAAPTAGLHFDDELLAAVKQRGVEVAYVSLLVGIGTFRPVQSDNLDEHEMHDETYTIPAATVDAIERTFARGGKVVAVGTTVVRALEASYQSHGRVKAETASTNLFIKPGYRFGVVGGLLTNFHLPESTLLALVCAFGGYEHVMRAYEHAVRQQYRFYSYGDCMFLRK